MKSIRQRLTRRLVLTLVALLGAGLAGIYLAAWQVLLKSLDSSLRVRALALTSLTEFEQGAVQFDFSPDFLAAYRPDRPRQFFEFRETTGRVLARSPSLRDADLKWRDGGTPARPIFFNVTLPGGRPGRAAALTFEVGPGEAAPVIAGPRPRVQLVVALDREDLNETLGGLFGAVLGCGVLVLLAGWLIVPRALARGLAPLETLGEQAARIDADSLAIRFAADDLPAELQPIAQRLNDLLARLEASFERERRFSADLAHELRTPLAELRSLAECALKWPEAREPGLDQEVLAITQQMEALATRLLTLTRGERGQLAVQWEPLDIASFVASAWQPFAARAAARGLRTSFAVAPASVSGDAALLRSVLNNLFDNAVDYAPAGSEITLDGDRRGSGYELHLANPAGPLAGQDVERCFDRFWRKDPARTGNLHVGLGLNLARTFATAMGWLLTARIDERGWIVFTLSTSPASHPTTPAPTASVGLVPR